MKVAIVSPHPVYPADSGDRIRTTQLAEALAAGGAGVEVVCYSWGRTPHAGRLPMRYVPGRPSGPLQYALWRARLAAARRRDPYAMFQFRPARHAMRQALLDLAPDVVDFQHSRTFFQLPIPSVVTFHNVESHRLSRDGDSAAARVAAFERAAAMAASAVVVFSTPDRERVRALISGSGPPVAEVPLGYYPGAARREAQREEMKAAAFVGSFDYGPNRDAARFLIQAWPRMRSAAGLERLLLIGRRASAHFSAGNGVEVASDVASVHEALAPADVLVVPVESGGGVRVKIIEAFALGIPVVSTALGIEGLEARDGVHAVVVQRAGEIAGGLERLRDVKVRRAIAENAYALWEQRYSPKRMAAGMLAVYESVAAKGSKAPR